MKLKHYDHDGRARFVTFSTHHRLPILTSDHFKYAITDAVRAVRQEKNLTLIGYVIMPEHVHLVLTLPERLKLGPVIGEIKRLSGARIAEALRASESTLLPRLSVRRDGRVKLVVWMRRCWDHNCRSDDYVWQKVRYCHDNPVKRGLVSNPAGWIWSSYRWYHGLSGVALEMDTNCMDV